MIVFTHYPISETKGRSLEGIETDLRETRRCRVTLDGGADPDTDD